MIMRQRISPWYYYTLLLLLFITTKLTIIPHHSVQGLDIGATLKNLANRGDNQHKNEKKAIVTTTKESTKTKESLTQDLIDASTGTITALEPNKEKEPITCNEIMAKAVVVANEQRAIIEQERNEALNDADSANKMVIEYREKVGEMEEVVRITKEETTFELEQMELEVNTTKKTTSAEMSRVQTEAKETVAQVRNSTKVEIETTIQEAKEKVEAAEQKAMTEIQQAQDEAAQQIALEKSSAQELIDAVNDKMVLLKESTSAQIRNMTLEVNQTVSSIQTKAKLEIAKTNQLASEKVYKAQAEIQAMEQTSKAEMTKIKKESTLAIQEANTNASRKMEQMRLDLNAEMAKLVQHMEEKVVGIEEDMEKVKTKAASDIDAMNLETQDKVASVLQEKDEMQTTLESQITSQQDEIAKLTQTIQALQQFHNDATDEATYWKQIYNRRLYVNTTDILLDTQATIHHSAAYAYKLWIQYGYDVKMAQLYQTYVINMYNEHLRDIIQEQVLPKYQAEVEPLIKEHVEPILQKHVEPIIDQHVLPTWIKANTILQSTILYLQSTQSQLYQMTCTTVQSKARTILKTLSQNPEYETDVPTFLQLFLSNISTNETCTREFVSTIFTIMGFTLIYLFKFYIWCVCWKIIKVPFQLIWFVCPLRWMLVLIRKCRKSSQEEEEYDVEEEQEEEEESPVPVGQLQDSILDRHDAMKNRGVKGMNGSEDTSIANAVVVEAHVEEENGNGVNGIKKED